MPPLPIKNSITDSLKKVNKFDNSVPAMNRGLSFLQRLLQRNHISQGHLSRDAIHATTAALLRRLTCFLISFNRVYGVFPTLAVKRQFCAVCAFIAPCPQNLLDKKYMIAYTAFLYGVYFKHVAAFFYLLAAQIGACIKAVTWPAELCTGQIAVVVRFFAHTAAIVDDAGCSRRVALNRIPPGHP